METLKKRVGELQMEAQQLVNQREQMYKSIKDIEVRLHQVVGAINELNQIIEGDKNEGDASSKSAVPVSPDEAK